ncbi:MAG: protein phosphatase 2C domain-containing protein [Desulfurivibrionaceae bacterium]|nr:protein phosphatase 2C domain-containing protein [Desulfobulbales bacterium]MDT8334529.1 protein phosphatase 2C domain-containing protein [Desulfurivibrionaceae bacterium]
MYNFFKKILPHPSLKLTYAGLSDVGLVRENNEDCYRILEGKNIFIVADGMGGHNAGEVASRAAIEVMQRYFSDKIVKAMRSNSQEVRHAMLTAFEKANRVVMDLAEEDGDLLGMGCTLIVAFIRGTTLYTCHVGDTRCYVVSENRIRKVTRDHTMTEEAPGNSPSRHVVTRVIGYPFPEPPECNTISLREGDRILLCSDGLWSMVDESTILETIVKAESPAKAAERLVELANKGGGDDNITVLNVFCG